MLPPGGIIPSEDEVDTLSDEQLYTYLSMYKPSIGPVVDSTRDLYRKMLLRAIADGGSLSKHELENESTAATTGSDLDFEIIGEDENSPAAGDVQEFIDDDKFIEEGVDVIGENEWVQNDPQEALIDPNPSSFCLKAFLFGFLLSSAFICIIFLLSFFSD